MGVVVPDVAAAGRFYSRVFNPDLHKEQELPLRYYVTLNPGYIALGSRANQTRAFFDHYCALVEDYDPVSMTDQLKTEGLAGGRFGIIPDADGLGLQLLGVPGGLAKSTEPAGRIVEQDALLRPMGIDHVLLYVADVDKSTQFYRKFFGSELPRQRSKSSAPERVWFQAAQTPLGLQACPAGESPRIDRFCVKVARFNRDSVSRELAALGATIVPGSDDVLHFRDPDGLGVELKPV
jgi:catechol 2,3-dioxygenase-like lactoylglutathione lyase family enzyme